MFYNPERTWRCQKGGEKPGAMNWFMLVEK